MEMSQLAKISYAGTGLNQFQVPEWDFRNSGDHKTSNRLFLQKSPRDIFTVELKRDMVENDRRLKTQMQKHRMTLSKDKQALEQVMRKNTKPFVCHRGNILSRYGQRFNQLPSSLHKHNEFNLNHPSTINEESAPMTVIDSGSIVSEQSFICKRCNKPYKESKNFQDSCRYHKGPIVAVFGGTCQHCGKLDYTPGCMRTFHTRKDVDLEEAQGEEKTPE